MNKIETLVLNPTAIGEAEKIMVCAARLTQLGHKIKNMQDFVALYEKEYTENTVKNFISLPHPSIQKFAVINVAIVGASRRFLSQITRHQNEVKFMSASLQYSDYSGEADFVIPYEILERGENDITDYLTVQCNAMDAYKDAIDAEIDNDSAGYMTPQGLRNILLISATPFQWKHMISQRICRRNTDETRYIMLKIWAELYELAPELFNYGTICMRHGTCEEGKLSCGKPIPLSFTPMDIIREDFPLLVGGTENENKTD